MAGGGGLAPPEAGDSVDGQDDAQVDAGVAGLQAVERLEKIVEALGEQKLPLEESIKTYEDGIMLYEYCSRIISDCEQRITKINLADGAEEAFSEEDNG